MNKNLFILLLLCPVINDITIAQTQSSHIQSSDHAYVTDLDLALRLSKDTKQEVVVIFSASWCSFCNLLKKDIPDLSGFDNKIICILDTDEEKKLARQFKVKTLPTSVRLNSNGQEINRIIGYNKTQYSEWLEIK